MFHRLSARGLKKKKRLLLCVDREDVVASGSRGFYRRDRDDNGVGWAEH